jgi:hypothetical protein
MASDGGDLRFGRADQCKPRYRSTAQVGERDAHDARRFACLAPRCPETIRGPRLVVAIGEDDRTALRCSIERSLERSADLYDDARSGLALPQSDMGPIIGRPRQAK